MICKFKIILKTRGHFFNKKAIFALGVRYAPGFPLYLCSPLFSPRSKKSPNSQIPVPESHFPHLAKDAAAIPNATGYEQ